MDNYTLIYKIYILSNPITLKFLFLLSSIFIFPPIPAMQFLCNWN